MQFPAHAAEHDIIEYVNWHCFHFLSNKVYHDWVVQEANKPDVQEWARKMLKAVELTNCFVDFTCDYILQVSRRNYGGISILCQIMHDALPIAKEYTSFSVNDCVVTGIKQRPCFEIMSGKHGDVCSFVHHSLLKCCQSIWCVMHIQDVLASCVAGFKKTQKTDTTLAAMIQAFEASVQRKHIVAYFLFVLQDVETIFSEDNIMQPRKEEIMFVECNSHNTTAAHKNKKKKTPIVSSCPPSSAATPTIIKDPTSQVASELSEHPAVVCTPSKPKDIQHTHKKKPLATTSFPTEHLAQKSSSSTSEHMPDLAAVHKVHTLHNENVPCVKHKKKKKKKLSVVSAPESLHCVQTEAPATATADPAETALLLYMQSATLATKQKNNYTKQTHNKKVQHSIAIQPETKASVSNKSLDALAILENAIAQPVRKKQKIAARPAFNTVIDDHQETPA
jgi:hypothetical protein